MVSLATSCSFPNGTNGTTVVGACLGPLGIDASQGAPQLAIMQSGGSDFAGATVNDAPCANCWVELCYDFVNGFSSTPDGFNLDWSSLNGGTEGLEISFGWVEGVTAAGVAIPAPINPAGLTGYCPLQAQTMTATEFLTGVGPGGTLPGGLFAVDAITGDGSPTICPTEEPGSSSGPNSTVSTGLSSGAIPPNWGLNATDIITRFCLVYMVSNSNADDCDGDGATEVNTSPGGSLAEADFCVPDPVCGFPEPTVALTENCGEFSFLIGPIDETLASGNGTDITFSTAPTVGPANTLNSVVGATLQADGTTAYFIQVCDSADATCCSEFGPFIAPVGITPDCGIFPANGLTVPIVSNNNNNN